MHLHTKIEMDPIIIKQKSGGDTNHYTDGQTDGRTDGQTDGHGETNIPP